MKSLLITTLSLTALTFSHAAMANIVTDDTSITSPENSIDLDENFLPPGTPFIQPNRAREVSCVNRCGDQFKLPSINSYNPAGMSNTVMNSERAQKVCLMNCLKRR